ncbi:MAG: hypothetical protein KGV56_00300 [Gammaproteobacteria bacterium]|nr:hypothetical protein [Gammaproteobacteria bacterium]
MNIDYLDLQQILAYMNGATFETSDSFFDNQGFDEFLAENYGLDIETFEKIIVQLIPFAMKSKSPLTDEIFVGFADHDKQYFIIKNTIEKGEENGK